MPECKVCGRKIKKGDVGPGCAKKLAKLMAIEDLKNEKVDLPIEDELKQFPERFSL